MYWQVYSNYYMYKLEALISFHTRKVETYNSYNSYAYRCQDNTFSVTMYVIMGVFSSFQTMIKQLSVVSTHTLPCYSVNILVCTRTPLYVPVNY